MSALCFAGIALCSAPTPHRWAHVSDQWARPEYGWALAPDWWGIPPDWRGATPHQSGIPENGRGELRKRYAGTANPFSNAATASAGSTRAPDSWSAPATASTARRRESGRVAV